MSESNPKESAGSEKPPIHLVPPALLLETSKVMELGARKYGPYNWRDTEVSLTTYLSAIMRHTMATLDGEDQDPESRRSHMGHVASCCGIILDAMHAGKLVDDRPAPGPASEIIQAMTANERERRAKEAEARAQESMNDRREAMEELQRIGQEMGDYDIRVPNCSHQKVG